MQSQLNWKQTNTHWTKFSFLNLDFSIMRIYDDFVLYGPRDLYDNTTVTISEHDSLEAAKIAGEKRFAEIIYPIVQMHAEITKNQQSE